MRDSMELHEMQSQNSKIFGQSGFRGASGSTKMARGQTMLIDLTFAVIIFALIFLTINSFYTERLSLHDSAQSFSEMYAISNSAVDSLIKTKGIPENWGVLPTSQISQIGLLGKNSSIDTDKLNAFKNLISDYNSTKVLLKLRGYDYFFSMKANPDINAGLPPMSAADKVVVTRTVNYNGGEVNAEFTLYKLH